jgi:hypothetical protein
MAKEQAAKEAQKQAKLIKMNGKKSCIVVLKYMKAVLSSLRSNKVVQA